MSWLSRISTNLREIRVIYAENHPSSGGARHFVQNNYSLIKRLNPGIPFIVRSNEDIEPWLVAKYDFGGERRSPISNLTEKQIIDELKTMVDLGAITFKANLYPYQQSYRSDSDVVDYDREDPDQHHV